MKRIGYTCLAVAAIALATTGILVGVAAATPPANGAILFPFTFHDCVFTTLTSANAYPASIVFDEKDLVCPGGQNMHTWDFSADGGASAIVFGNTDGFHCAATLDLNRGSAVPMEGGLLVSPWYSVNTDGYFNVKDPNHPFSGGEIAVFGGVLPFYSFSDPLGFNLRYGGGPIRLEIIFQPNCTTAADPGKWTYIVNYRGITYASPALNGTCNASEEAAHGCWGLRDNARVGGRIANQMFAGGPGAAGDHNIGSFFDIFFEPLERNCSVPTTTATWGKVKAQYR